MCARKQRVSHFDLHRIEVPPSRFAKPFLTFITTNIITNISRQIQFILQLPIYNKRHLHFFIFTQNTNYDEEYCWWITRAWQMTSCVLKRSEKLGCEDTFGQQEKTSLLRFSAEKSKWVLCKAATKRQLRRAKHKVSVIEITLLEDCPKSC